MEEHKYTPKMLSNNTNHAIGDVIAAAKTLKNIYSAEINALQEPDTKEFLNLQDSKLVAAQDYYAFMTQMLERKTELENIDPTLKKRLREIHTHFSDTTQQNLKALKRMKRCSERLGNTLRKAAIRAAQKSNTLSYSENGRLPNESSRKIVSSGLSETV